MVAGKGGTGGDRGVGAGEHSLALGPVRLMLVSPFFFGLLIFHF